MDCETLLTERNQIFYKIVDILPVEKSVELFNLDDSEVLEILLGAVNDTVRLLDSELWSYMMYCIAKYMYPMFQKFKHVLSENRFNFNF